MQDVIENVEMKFTQTQNAGLEESFANFYKLISFPKIKRKLIVPMEEYRAFVKSKAKVRTQFESGKEFDLGFDSFGTPFKFIATHTEFIFPSGRTISLHETLDKPNGLTENVSIGEPDNLNFKFYSEAEQYVVEQFLKEIK